MYEMIHQGKTDLEEASTALYAASSKGSSLDPGNVLTCTGPSNVARFRSTQGLRSEYVCVIGHHCMLANWVERTCDRLSRSKRICRTRYCHCNCKYDAAPHSTRSSGPALPTTYSAFCLITTGQPSPTKPPGRPPSQQRNKHARRTEVSSLPVAHHAMNCCILIMRAMSVS